MERPFNRPKPELLCPAGSLRALQVAVDAGADCVYMGLRDATNARNFAGLNFDEKATREGIAYAHARGRKVLMARNTLADARDETPWRRAVDTAAGLGIDALILADLAVIAYAARAHPTLPLHLSVQASATNHEAIELATARTGRQMCAGKASLTPFSRVLRVAASGGHFPAGIVSRNVRPTLGVLAAAEPPGEKDPMNLIRVMPAKGSAARHGPNALPPRMPAANGGAP